MVYTPVDELPAFEPPKRPRVRYTDPRGHEWPALTGDQPEPSPPASAPASADTTRAYVARIREQLHTHTTDPDPVRAAAIDRARQQRAS